MSNTIGSIVRSARLSHGLSQQALGDECGVSQAAISFIELGKGEPSVVTLVRIGSVLGNHLIADVIRQVIKEVRT